MKSHFLSILLFLLFNLASAQINLRNGFIFTNSGDTISGFIQFRGDIKNSVECNFYSINKEAHTFLPFEIKGFQFESGKYYVSRYVKGVSSKSIFAEFLLDGEKDLFYFRDSGGSHYLLSENDSTLIEIPLETKQIEKNNKQYYVLPTKHIGFLKYYFQDAPKIHNQIDQIKSPDRKDLIRLTKNYHELTCEKGVECIEYNKRKFPISVAFQPYFGYLNIEDSKDLVVHYGGIAHFWLPIANENLYFKTGYLYSQLRNNSHLTKIPIQLEYVFPFKIIKPKLGFGINMFQFKAEEGYIEGMPGTKVISGGFLIKLHQSIYLDFTATLENPTLPNINGANDWIYSFGTGMWIKF
jgi:hypothetical protein